MNFCPILKFRTKLGHVNKNKPIELYTSKILGNSKDNNNDNDFDLVTHLSTLNSKLVEETINSCNNMLDSSVSKTVDCRSNLSTL